MIFSSKTFPTRKLGEVSSGIWYHQTYNFLVVDPSNDVLSPLFVAMDKTATSSSADLHIYAIIFITTILNHSFKIKPTLGGLWYIYVFTEINI